MLKNRQRKKLAGYIAVPVLIFIALGAVSTYIHLNSNTFELSGILSMNLNLLVMSVLVTTGLLIRFGKWHFFIRLNGIRIKIRRSFFIFFTSLFVNLFFPLLIGEVLTKNYFLRKENYRSSFRNISVILLERLLDVIAILMLGVVFLLFSSERAIANSPAMYVYIAAAASVVILTAVLLSGKIYFSGKFIVSFLTGAAGWFVIYLIYFALPGGASTAVSFPDFGYIFSNNLVFYPTTPMGLFVSGNYLYIALGGFISRPELLAQTVIGIRIVSVLPAFVMGIVLGINELRKRNKPDEFHFDEISDDYTEMIPEHVRERLIERKCGMIINDLNSKHDDLSVLTGLDLGGGKGWYTSRLIDLTGSKNIILVERSVNQAKDAAERDPRIKTVIADITELPFEENSADFAFSINVFHHLDDREAQRRAFDTLGRVLKPGGKFYLHEMNVQNILFKLYMNYFFPLVKTIDEGIEYWIEPEMSRAGNFASSKIIYFTFLPEFTGKTALKLFKPLERRLEKSKFARYSAHYFRVFENNKKS